MILLLVMCVAGFPSVARAINGDAPALVVVLVVDRVPNEAAEMATRTMPIRRFIYSAGDWIPASVGMLAAIKRMM